MISLAVDNTKVHTDWCCAHDDPELGNVLIREMHDVEHSRIIKVTSIVNGVMRTTYPIDDMKVAFSDLDYQSLVGAHKQLFGDKTVAKEDVCIDWFRIYRSEEYGQILIIEADGLSDECEEGSITFETVIKTEARFWNGASVDAKHIDLIEPEVAESLLKFGTSEEESHY